jgi:hypothetical protein
MVAFRRDGFECVPLEVFVAMLPRAIALVLVRHIAPECFDLVVNRHEAFSSGFVIWKRLAR